MDSPTGLPNSVLPDRSDLERAAAACLIDPKYWDIFGREHQASDQVLSNILRAMDVDASTRETLARSLRARQQREWLTTLPATLVLRGSERELPLSVPMLQRDSIASLAIHFEDGASTRFDIALAGLPVAEESSIQGQTYIRKIARLPDALPLGYHQLRLHLAGQSQPPTRLIVAPERVYEPAWLASGRAAGIAISLYGLRSARNWGCGDTTDLKNLIDWVAERSGASFIALNPLHAIFNRSPFNTSPYLPNSIFYRNPIYLDIEQIDEFRNSQRAQALLAYPALQQELQSLRAAEFVEYERVNRLKTRFLKLLFHSFLSGWRADTPPARDLRRYIEREGDLLHRFAVHSALDEALHRQCPDVWTWRQWPEQYQDPDSRATREFEKKHWRSVLFHKYVQWQLDLQFASAQQYARERGLSIGLYHDLALATDRFGSDLWAHRHFFIDGCRVGAPPDSFSPKGQDWAFPPPDSQHHFDDGYRLFSESIRKNSRHGGALRIDHVMRFFRLYWIPDGADATQGTYVRDRWRDLLGVLALESVREKVLVIGEDLGTVPDEVRDGLHSFGILSYRLLYFEQHPDGSFHRPDEYPRDALASTTTHDLPTLAGFWAGRDIQARREAGVLPDQSVYKKMVDGRASEKQRLLDVLLELKLLPDVFPRSAAEIPELTGELHNAIVGFLASTPSKLMLLNQEDLLKETEQQNLPGTTSEHPNWRRKMRKTIEELWTSDEVSAFAAMFHAWLERTGRLNGSYMK